MKIIGRMEKDAHKSTLNTIAIVLLLALACMFFPTDYLSPFLGRFYSGALVRFIFGGVGVLFICFYSFNGLLNFKGLSIFGIAVFFAALIVAVNNFPILPFTEGNAAFSVRPLEIFAYAVFCLSIGFFEEIFFRGLLLPLFIIRFKNFKYGKLWAVAISSATFGLVHIINLFGGAGFGSVILQIGYSTLIGAMCAVVMVFTRNVWLAVALHTVYNFGGLLLSYDIISLKGPLWFTASVILTAVVAVLITAFICIMFVKRYKTLLSADEFKIKE